MAKASRKNTLTGSAVTVAPTKDVDQNGPCFEDDTANAFEASAESETAINHDFSSEMSVDAIKTQVMRHILSVINTGTYDEVNTRSISQQRCNSFLNEKCDIFLFDGYMHYQRLNATITLFFIFRFWRCTALARYVRCAFSPNATLGTPLAPSKTSQTV